MKLKQRFLPWIGLKDKSYYGCELDIELVSVEDLTKKEQPTATEKRALKHELSGSEPVKYLISVDNKNTPLGRITTAQIKDIFYDIGFNHTLTFSNTKSADFSAVMSIKRFLLTDWRYLPDFFSLRLEKFFQSKFVPGKERLHVRGYENNDGKWLLACHIDYNWINLNLIKIIKAHVVKGSGDYRRGTTIVYKLLKEFQKNISQEHYFRFESLPIVKKLLHFLNNS